MKTITSKESAADFLMSNLEVCQTKEDIIFVFWELWVSSVTINAREFQQVFANAAVNAWFLEEFATEERDFKSLIAEYPDTTGRDKDWLWCKCVSKLMSRFPMSTLREAKRQTVKPQATKVAGIKIELSIHNQN